MRKFNIFVTAHPLYNITNYLSRDVSNIKIVSQNDDLYPFAFKNGMKGQMRAPLRVKPELDNEHGRPTKVFSLR